jgi:hypothetical protein
VFYKPYESQGQAWPITFARMIWGVFIFLIFMTGIFILRKAYVLSSLLAPLLVGTLVWWWYMDKTFRSLSKHIGLGSICEVQRGEDSAEVTRLKAGHPVTWSQRRVSLRVVAPLCTHRALCSSVTSTEDDMHKMMTRFTLPRRMTGQIM